MAESANIHLKLLGKDGKPIEGEAENARFVKQIDLDDWKWALGTDQTNGKPEPTKFSFKKRMCRATPRMLSAMASGEPLEAVVEIEDYGIVDNNAKPMFELKLTLKQVLVVNYSCDLDVGDKGGKIDENWDFDYDSITLDYRAVTHEGTMTVEYLRPAGAKLRETDRSEAQILKLAENMGREDLKQLWVKIKALSESQKFDKPTPKAGSDSNDGKSGQKAPR